MWRAKHPKHLSPNYFSPHSPALLPKQPKAWSKFPHLHNGLISPNREMPVWAAATEIWTWHGSMDKQGDWVYSFFSVSPFTLTLRSQKSRDKTSWSCTAKSFNSCGAAAVLLWCSCGGTTFVFLTDPYWRGTRGKKKLFTCSLLSQCLSTQVYKWVLKNLMLGWYCNGLASHPESRRNIPSRFMPLG